MASRRWTVLLLFIAFGVSLSAQASETRIGTLRGLSGITDETDVYTYPGALPLHDIALIELGTFADQDVYGGAFKRFGGISGGVVVSRDDSLMSEEGLRSFSLVSDWLQRSVSNTDANALLPAPERPVDLFFATSTGPGAGFGVRLTAASFRDKTAATEGPTNKTDRRAEQIDLGFGYTAESKSSRFDASLSVGAVGELKRLTETATTTTENKYKRGAETIAAMRYIGPGSLGRPFVEVILSQRSPKVESKTGTTKKTGKLKDTIMLTEGGYVLTPASGVLVGGGGGLLYIDSKGPIITSGTGVGAGAGKPAIPSILASDDQLKKTTTLIYANLATEALIASGFGFLGGLQYTLWGEIKTEDDFSQGKPKSTETVDQTPDSSLWALGLFYKVDTLRADASLAKGFLHKGPNFVSGDTTNNMFARISVTYLL